MKNKKSTDTISTFLGSDDSIDGTIEFKGTIRLDGKVTGKISSNGGTLIVGEKAVANADIAVGVLIVMGEVNGTIDVQERIEVYPPGRLGGDIQAPVISIEPGSIFNGTCTMKMQATSSGKSASPLPLQAVSADTKRK
jgi:cytoskeletal protein CcmA (bactofilin family)